MLAICEGFGTTILGAPLLAVLGAEVVGGAVALAEPLPLAEADTEPELVFEGCDVPELPEPAELPDVAEAVDDPEDPEPPAEEPVALLEPPLVV